jgi:HD superfamily phosphohydrolase
VPKWGLTEAQRRAEPWGLSEKILGPAMVVTDPIHQDVFLTSLEVTFVNTEPFQRLRRIKQLGNTHLVYPGATHSRFAHSLGSVRVAQDLIDAIIDQRNTRKPVPDLFQEWDDGRTRAFEALAHRSSSEEAIDEADTTAFFTAFAAVERQFGEAIVAARLGALLHDLCHVPFGHSIEDELNILVPHDENARRFDRLWARLRLPATLDAQLRQGGLYRELRGLILPKEADALSKRTNAPALRYPFVEDIVGNTICADLLDYLERDHRATGLPVALGRRFVSSFYVTPKGNPETEQHMVLRIGRDGRERTDVVTEVLKYLRYRYELSERALVHHSKLGADAMIGKALEMWYDLFWLEKVDRASHGCTPSCETAAVGEIRPLDYGPTAARRPVEECYVDTLSLIQCPHGHLKRDVVATLNARQLGRRSAPCNLRVWQQQRRRKTVAERLFGGAPWLAARWHSICGPGIKQRVPKLVSHAIPEPLARDVSHQIDRATAPA